MVAVVGQQRNPEQQQQKSKQGFHLHGRVQLSFACRCLRYQAYLAPDESAAAAAAAAAAEVKPAISTHVQVHMHEAAVP